MSWKCLIGYFLLMICLSGVMGNVRADGLIATENGVFSDSLMPGGEGVHPPVLSPAARAVAHQRLLDARQRAMTGSRQLFDDDFEDGDIAGWQDGGGGFTAAATSTTAADGTIYSMQMDGGTLTHYTGRYHTFTAGTPDYISVWLNSGSIADSDTYFVTGDASSPSNNGIIFLYAKDNALWNLYSGSEHYSLNLYTANTWYHHEFLLDWGTREVDWYIDGVLQHADVPFRSSTTTAVDRVYAHHFNNSTGWFDQYYFSDSGLPTATPTETPVPTATPTETPVPTVTPTETPAVTPTPAPVPATGPAGVSFLMLLIGGLMGLNAYRRR
ncbi:MAG TPA: hypothetical protein PLV45_00840 [bacterium]|nr:hypothetical protein [bacterium]